MAIYAMGDIQGCAIPLEELLEKIQFDPDRDKLWLTGDLVNRGQHSLKTLRLVMRLGSSAVSVLGNHDLHLLAVDAGVKKMRPGDTMQQILRASDREELIHWVRNLPMAHCDRELKTLMVHAGVYPGWRRKELLQYAGEVEGLLRGDCHIKFLNHMYGRYPIKWNPQMRNWDRARFITNVLTRMRYCDHRGNLNFTHKGPPGSQPRRLAPWFTHPERRCRKWRIIFGHWSSLGFIRTRNVIGLDSGCVWGRSLTAVRLDGDQPGRRWAVKCKKQ